MSRGQQSIFYSIGWWYRYWAQMVIPHPTPIPGVSKSLLRGAKQIVPKPMFDDVHGFYKQVNENINESFDNQQND